MDLYRFSPCIHHAMYSTLSPFGKISRRIIYDYELIYVLEGSYDITVNGKTYTVKKNDAVLLRPGVPHSFSGRGERFVQPHIHFDLQYDENSRKRSVSFKDLPDMSEEERQLVQEDILPGVIPDVFVPRKLDVFQKHFFRAIDIYREKPKNYLIAYKSELLYLLDIIFEQFSCYSEKEEADEVNVITSVKSYIDANCRQVLTLDSLAQQFYVNKYTLMRNFGKQYGVGVINYYNSKRAELAKALLLNTNLTVSAVSEELNFTDIYTFSRFFKNNTGLSPLQFRRERSKTGSKERTLS